MTATATRLVQERFPVSPLGGTLGGGMNTVSWRPSKTVWNKTTGDVINAPVQAQVDPLKGRMGWKDDSRAGEVGVPLAVCDDPNNSAADWWWIYSPHVQGIDSTEMAFQITLATADIVLLANLVPLSSNTVGTALIDITSSSLTVTHPSPGIINIEDPGGGGGGAPHASDTVFGLVETDVATANPRVYLKSSVDTLLGSEATARAAADSTNAAAITSEATTARAAESANATGITNEAATARAAESANATAITSETTARTAADITSRRETVNFTATGAAWYTAEGAETWDSVGTLAGTFTFAKSVAATPDTFSGTTLPVVLAGGDTLQITCTALRTGPPARGIFRMRRTA